MKKDECYCDEEEEEYCFDEEEHCRVRYYREGDTDCDKESKENEEKNCDEENDCDEENAHDEDDDRDDNKQCHSKEEEEFKQVLSKTESEFEGGQKISIIKQVCKGLIDASDFNLCTCMHVLSAVR